MPVVIGIDTSCYTTSVCAVDYDEKLFGDCRKVLEVKQGNRGLRQSEAVFQHMNNLPNLISDIFNTVPRDQISYVSVSTSPRPVEGSYMPVFTAGANMGQVMASSLGVDTITFSHQEGHIRAGIWSSGGPNCEKFLCLHLSGGTTEILKVEKEGYHFNIEIVGQTRDISAGQLIDRVGVALGLNFPAGREFEKLAQNGQDKIVIPSSVKELDVSFSGAETRAVKLLDTEKPEDIAFAVQKCIAKTLEKAIARASEKYALKDVLLVGGVASNNFIKDFLKAKLTGCRLYFGQPTFSVDNSVGVALLGVDYAKANNKR